MPPARYVVPVASLGPNLKTVSGELVFSAGILQLTSGQDAIRQAAECRLRTFRNEWFLDGSIGVPWFERIFGRKAAAAPVRSVLREELMAIPGVVEVPILDVAFDPADRSLAISFVLQTAAGEVAGSVSA